MRGDVVRGEWRWCEGSGGGVGSGGGMRGVEVV